MNTNTYIAKHITKIIGLLGFLFVIADIPFFVDYFTYDEPHYLSNLDLIREFGLGNEFLVRLKGPAGPLHAYLHYILYPLTKGGLLATRLVNIFLSIVVLLGLHKTVKVLNPKASDMAFLIFCIPMMLSAMVVAQTEIPAMAFLTWGLFHLAKGVKAHERLLPEDQLGHFVYAGLLFAVATAGRQPYLVCSAGLFPLIFHSSRRLVKHTFVAGLLAISIPAYLFYIWGGIAPDVGRAIATEGLIAPFHFFLALGYAAACMAILSPKFFLFLGKKQLGIYTLIFSIFIAICVALDFQFFVFKIIFMEMFDLENISYIGYLTASGIMMIGLYFCHSLMARCFEQKDDLLFLSLSLMTFLLLLSNISVTHLFSTRYILQAAPLFITLASYYRDERTIAKLMHILGLLLGILSVVAFQMSK